MELSQTIGISIAIIFSLWIVFYISVLLWNIEKESIRARNPALLLLSSIGMLFLGVVSALRGSFVPIPCYLVRESRVQITSLCILPDLLRGAQYLFLTNDKYRRRFPKFKSTKKILSYHFTFWVSHTLVAETLSHVSDISSEECFPKWNVVYGFFLGICFVVATCKIFWMIPWSYDIFYIAEDLKHCSVIWAFGGLALVIVIATVRVLDKVHLGHIFFSWVCVAGPVAHFFVTVVRPIHEFVFRSPGLYASSKKKAKKRLKYVSAKILPLENQSDIDKKSKNKAAEVTYLKNHMISVQNQLQLLEFLFQNHEAIEKIHDFSNRRLCTETTLFLENVYKYKVSWVMESTEASLERSKKLIADFIHPSGPYSINISGRMRSTVLRCAEDMSRGACLRKFEREFFDECYKEICMMFFDNVDHNPDYEDFWLICIEHNAIEDLLKG